MCVGYIGPGVIPGLDPTVATELRGRGGGEVGLLYFRLDIILVKDFQNTLNTYFSGIDPKSGP